MQIKTDRELLESYATDRNEAAFAELVARHSPMVYRACLRVLANASDAEEATQAAFLVLVRKAGSLRQEGCLNGWLHRVARHVALQALRVRSDRERRQEQVAVSQEPMIVDAPDAATEVVFKAVDAELDGLSAILREAVVLRYLRGFSEQEAAAQAGCAVSAMKWRTCGGIAKLRARLAKRGIALSGVALASLLTSEASASVPETLLPSLLAAVKTAAATTATATTATSAAAMLAKGAMKAMYIAKVKMVAAIAAAVIVTGTAVPVGIVVAQAAEAALAHSALEKMGSRSPDADHMPLAGKAAELEKKAQEAKVTLNFKEVTADNALNMLSTVIGIPIRKTDIPKDAKVTLELKDVSGLEGVQRVTKMLGLTYGKLSITICLLLFLLFPMAKFKRTFVQGIRPCSGVSA